MSESFEELASKAQKLKMTQEQEREQRRSFAYGNAHIENKLVTRKMIADADERIEREEAAKNAAAE